MLVKFILAILLPLLGSNVPFQTRQDAQVLLGHATNTLDMVPELQELVIEDPEVRRRVEWVIADYYSVWPTNSRTMPRLDVIKDSGKLSFKEIGLATKVFRHVWVPNADEPNWGYSEEYIQEQKDMANTEYRQQTLEFVDELIKANIPRSRIIYLLDIGITQDKK